MRPISPLPTKPWLWAYLWPARQTPIRTIFTVIVSIFSSIAHQAPVILFGAFMHLLSVNDLTKAPQILIPLGFLFLLQILCGIAWHWFGGWINVIRWWTITQMASIEWVRTISIDASLRYWLSRLYGIIRTGAEAWANLSRVFLDQLPNFITCILINLAVLYYTVPSSWMTFVVATTVYIFFAVYINRWAESIRALRREKELAMETLSLRSILQPSILLKRRSLQETQSAIQNLGVQAVDLSKKAGRGSYFSFEIPYLMSEVFRIGVIAGVVYGFGWIDNPLVQIPVMFVVLSSVSTTINYITDLMWDYWKMKTDVDKLINAVSILPLAPNLDTGAGYIPKGGAIRFDDVAFGYSAEKLSLWPLSLSIRSGEHVALVGPSGAGKTTFVRIAMAYLLPTSGSVFLDWQDTKTLDLSTIVDHIGYLQQEPQLFDGTIRENLTYGLGEISEESLHRALRNAAADFVLDDLKDGVDSIIGERGLLLSGGERQRLAIARLFLQSPSIIVLDEPTAALDSLSEAKVTEAIHRLSAGKTIITIAHRLQTVREADRILVLKWGNIEAIGTHDELLSASSLYASMVDLQSGRIREE